MQNPLQMLSYFCTDNGRGTPAVTMATLNGSVSHVNGSNGTALSSAAAAREKALVETLVSEYLAHSSLWRQQHQQHQLQQSRQKDPLTAEITQALLALTDEYERRYKSQLMELSASWDISPTSPRTSFMEVLDTVFLDGCNWGRIVTVFIFVGLFVRKCQAHGVASTAAAAVSVGDVSAWAVDYLQDKLSPWIREQGGWIGLARFYRNGDAASQLASEGRMFRRLLLTAGAGLALLSLGSLLVNSA